MGPGGQFEKLQSPSWFRPEQTQRSC
jgi:hypothetical protein